MCIRGLSRGSLPTKSEAAKRGAPSAVSGFSHRESETDALWGSAATSCGVDVRDSAKASSWLMRDVCASECYLQGVVGGRGESGRSTLNVKVADRRRRSGRLTCWVSCALADRLFHCCANRYETKVDINYRCKAIALEPVVPVFGSSRN